MPPQPRQVNLSIHEYTLKGHLPHRYNLVTPYQPAMLSCGADPRGVHSTGVQWRSQQAGIAADARSPHSPPERPSRHGRCPSRNPSHFGNLAASRLGSDVAPRRLLFSVRGLVGNSCVTVIIALMPRDAVSLGLANNHDIITIAIELNERHIQLYEGKQFIVNLAKAWSAFGSMLP